MKINIVEIEEDFCPRFMSDGASAMDVFAREISYNDSAGYLEVKLGFNVEVDESVTMLALPRSSISNKGLHLANSVAVIDPDFRGEVRLRYYPALTPMLFDMKPEKGLVKKFCESRFVKGEAVGQIMFLPNLTRSVKMSLTKSLSSTDRGEGGFGSTDKKDV